MARKTAHQATELEAGEHAYALAMEHRAQLEPRLPPGTIDTLATDLTTLGATPPAPTAPAPAAPPPAAPPPLADALASAAKRVSAIHHAVTAAKARTGARKAYGAGSRATGTDVTAILAAAEKILARATSEPAEAHGLGILPADIAELGQAVTDLKAAEAAAHGPRDKAAPTGKAKRAATARMDDAVGRIAGAGVLAFALTADVRAKFEALRAK